MADVLIIKCWAPSPTSKSKVPPLGAMYLAAILRGHGHDVHILHCADDPASLKKISRAIADIAPDVIGISAIVPEFAVFKNLAGFLAETAPEIPVMVGGPLASSNPIATLKTPGISVIAQGEADRTILDLVDALASGRDPSGIPGTAVMRDGTVVYGPRREPLTPEELDGLPLPAWDLIDLRELRKYRGMASVGTRRYMQVSTSRGCPFHCIYCHGTMGRTFRPRSVDSVLAEIREIREKLDIHEFEIVDDCFNLDRERMHAILNGIIAFGDPKIRIQFPNGLRSDLLTQDDILLLRKAGTNFISFAIETASPRLQKLIRKNLDIERAVQAITMADKAGIFCNGFFMLGFPTETHEEAQSTIDLAVSTRLHEALFFKVNPFKGTELFKMAVEQSGCNVAGIPLDELDYFNVEHNLSLMSDEEFKNVYARAYRSFYLTPGRGCRIIARHPRKLQLFRYLPEVVSKSVVRLLEIACKHSCKNRRALRDAAKTHA